MTQIVAYNLRYRQAGTAAWTHSTHPSDAAITLRGLSRGAQYDVEAQSVGENGLTSDWVPANVTVTAEGVLVGPIAQLQVDLVAQADALALEAAERLEGDAAEAAARAAAIANAILSVDQALGAPAYDPATPYAVGALVRYTGGIYRAIAATTGNLPTNPAFWTALGQIATNTLGNAVAIQAIDTRVDTVEGVQTAQTSQIAALDAELDGKASAGALSTLDARVTSAEGSITAQSSSLTVLNAKINPNNNMLLNPTFLAGKDNWLSAGTSAVLVDNQNGTFLQMPATAGNTFVDQTVAVPAGFAYAASADVYLSNSAGAAFVQLVYRDGADNALTTVSSSAAGAASIGAWARVAVTGVAPAGTAKVTVRLITTGNTLDTYFRRAKLERGSVATVYTDERTVAGNVTLTQALDVRASTLEQQGAGVNLLPNSEPRNGFGSWSFNHTGGWSVAVNIAGAAWQPKDMYAFSGLRGGVTPGDSYFFVDSPQIPAVPGKRYMASVYTELHRSRSYMGIVWLDASGAAISSDYSATVDAGPTGVVGSATNLSTWARQVVAAVAPSNAQTMILRMFGIGNGGDNPYVWFVRPMLEETKSAAQTQPSAWAAGGSEFSASYTLALDVNGYVSGFQSRNNGQSADFTILADNFWLVSPGASKRRLFGVNASGVFLSGDLYMGSGRIISETATHMKVQGTGFGTANQFVEWFGPKMAISACSEANAVYYFKTNGSAYFGGTLSAGVNKNSVQSTGTGAANEVILGPFSTAGGVKSIIASYSYADSAVVGGNQNATYNGAAFSADVRIERSINGGAWTQVNSIAAAGTSTSTYDNGENLTFAEISMGNSVTFTDSTAATSNLRFRIRINARTTPWGGGNITQTISLQSTEG